MKMILSFILALSSVASFAGPVGIDIVGCPTQAVDLPQSGMGRLALECKVPGSKEEAFCVYLNGQSISYLLQVGNLGAEGAYQMVSSSSLNDDVVQWDADGVDVRTRLEKSEHRFTLNWYTMKARFDHSWNGIMSWVLLPSFSRDGMECRSR